MRGWSHQVIQKPFKSTNTTAQDNIKAIVMFHATVFTVIKNNFDQPVTFLVCLFQNGHLLFENQARISSVMAAEILTMSKSPFILPAIISFPASHGSISPGEWQHGGQRLWGSQIRHFCQFPERESKTKRECWTSKYKYKCSRFSASQAKVSMPEGVP